jgi:plasmid stabilization system protein ParE
MVQGAVAKRGSQVLDRVRDAKTTPYRQPEQLKAVEGEVRRAGFRRFPHGLFFVITAGEVRVFACFHASRDPRRWQERN